jgi:hypothetical protein
VQHPACFAPRMEKHKRYNSQLGDSKSRKAGIKLIPLRSISDRGGGETMGIIGIDEVVGITDHTGKVKCRDCMKDEDWRQIRSQDQVITEEKKHENVTSDDEIIDRYNRICFCDYCKKRMIPPLT